MIPFNPISLNNYFCIFTMVNTSSAPLILLLGQHCDSRFYYFEHVYETEIRKIVRILRLTQKKSNTKKVNDI